MYFLYIILAIMFLLFMVLVHEFGHYIVGRMLNFKITEFSVGFGKALFSRKNKRGELISLRLFPLGGYCAFAGEEETDKNNKDAFTNQAPWKRILVFLAGVTFNFATAVFFSFILLVSVGYDIPQVKSFMQFNTTEIKHMVDEEQVVHFWDIHGIDEDLRLQEGDIVISVDGEKIDFAYGVTFGDALNKQKTKLNAHLDEDKPFEEFPVFECMVKRDGEYKTVYAGFHQVLVYKVDDNGDYILKENSTDEYETEYKYYWNVNSSAYVHSFTEALERAVPVALGFAWVVLKSFFMLITFQLPISAIGGPITTITTIATVTQQSSMNLLVLIPLISANLAVFNALPIPALDGCHVVFTAIEAIRKKPIKRETENLIHTIGLLILFGSVILIDILHFLL
ncbi:MAG: site-2 protease family protein [Clostridia bacterium]|nr:site-2 protease family protein [Clostridia bacterium]